MQYAICFLSLFNTIFVQCEIKYGIAFGENSKAYIVGIFFVADLKLSDTRKNVLPPFVDFRTILIFRSGP